MDKFVVNIIHRPEMVPEYAEKVTGHGKEENIGRKALLTESLDIFRFQNPKRDLQKQRKKMLWSLCREWPLTVICTGAVMEKDFMTGI